MGLFSKLEDKIERATRPKFPINDPWKKLEMEKFHPFYRFLTGSVKGLFPGLGYATVAFAGYCLYEHFFMDKKHH